MSRAAAIYWVSTAMGTLAALFVLYDFVAFNLPRMIAELNNGLPGLFRVSPAVALPIGIAMALWLRSTAALWLLGIHTLAYRLHYFLGADPFEGQGITLAGLLRHPITLLAEAGVLIYLIRKGELGRA